MNDIATRDVIPRLETNLNIINAVGMTDMVTRAFNPWISGIPHVHKMP